MPEYDNTNRGAIWPKRQDAKEGAPDWKIEMNYQGKDLSIAIWRRRESDNPNGPAYRFNIEDKEQQNTQPAPAPASADQDIPF